jgi:hypothetical protein
MPEIAITEAVAGLVLGGGSVLGGVALYLKRKTASMDIEQAEQTAEHEQRLANLKAVVPELPDFGPQITAEVQRLLPAAVAQVQEDERLRVAEQRAREAELMDTILKRLKEMGEGEP